MVSKKVIFLEYLIKVLLEVIEKKNIQQEWDYILNGSLKVVIGDHTEILNEGDSLYYNSNQPHGMIAYGGQDCEFLAVLIKK